MNKYFTTFKDIDTYNSFVASAECPNINVSYISDSDEVKYFKEHASQTPFTMEIVSLPEGMTEVPFALCAAHWTEDSEFEWPRTRIKYSKDNGTTWSRWYEKRVNADDPVLNFDGELILHEGDKVMFIGENIFTVSRFFVDTGATVKTKVSGNPCSFFFGDDFTIKSFNDFTIKTPYCPDPWGGYNSPFYEMFTTSDGLKVIDAGGLWLPGTSLPNGVFQGMFDGQDELISVPNIYAQYLPDHACERMFKGCSSIITMPDIYADTIKGISVFNYMFQNCTSLATVKPIRISKMIVPSDIGFVDGFIEMFANCTALTASPTWKVNQMKQEDTGTFYFARTFQGCTGMVTCDWEMFNVPNTHFGVNNMHGFCYDCSSLVTTPVMGSNTFETEVYPEDGAFTNCTSLSTVIWLATNMPNSFGDNCFVQSGGTLVLRDDWQTRWTSGDWIGVKVPSSWTIKTWTQYQGEINA